MSNITIQEEYLLNIMTEVKPLLDKHWVELTVFPEIPLKVNWPHYIASEFVGNFKAYIARDNGKLVGYLAYFLGMHHHYATTLVATEDVFFVDPEHRTGTTGLKLLKFAELELKKLDVDLVIHHSKVAHDLGPILVRRGFKATDNLFMKRLGV